MNTLVCHLPFIRRLRARSWERHCRQALTITNPFTDQDEAWLLVHGISGGKA